MKLIIKENQYFVPLKRSEKPVKHHEKTNFYSNWLQVLDCKAFSLNGISVRIHFRLSF